MRTTLRKGLAGRSDTKPIEQLGHKKPVQLQVNNSGAWKTVISFDAGKNMESEEVLSAAGTLGCIDGKCTFRIVTNDGLQDLLMIWSATDGWKPRSRP